MVVPPLDVKGEDAGDADSVEGGEGGEGGEGAEAEGPVSAPTWRKLFCCGGP